MYRQQSCDFGNPKIFFMEIQVSRQEWLASLEIYIRTVQIDLHSVPDVVCCVCFGLPQDVSLFKYAAYVMHSYRSD